MIVRRLAIHAGRNAFRVPAHPMDIHQQPLSLNAERAKEFSTKNRLLCFVCANFKYATRKTVLAGKRARNHYGKFLLNIIGRLVPLPSIQFSGAPFTLLPI